MALNNDSNKKCHNCNWRMTGDCSEEIDSRRCNSWFPIGHTFHKIVREEIEKHDIELMEKVKRMMIREVGKATRNVTKPK